MKFRRTFKTICSSIREKIVVHRIVGLLWVRHVPVPAYTLIRWAQVHGMRWCSATSAGVCFRRIRQKSC